jgi:hypothetical protein
MWNNAYFVIHYKAFVKLIKKGRLSVKKTDSEIKEICRI